MSRMRARGQHSIISVSVTVLRLIILYFSRVVYDHQIENSMIVAIFYDKIMRSMYTCTERLREVTTAVQSVRGIYRNATWSTLFELNIVCDSGRISLRYCVISIFFITHTCELSKWQPKITGDDILFSCASYFWWRLRLLQCRPSFYIACSMMTIAMILQRQRGLADRCQGQR